MTMIESKVVNIEKAPGKFVPTLVNARQNPEYFEEVTNVVEEVAVEKPKKAKKKAAPKKKAAAKKKPTAKKK